MHIVLVSSGQPSANPRLIKEAIALSSSGYAITVIYCPLSPWADRYDEELFKKNVSIKWVCAGYHSTEQKTLYVFARLRQKMYQYIFRAGIRNAFTAVRSMSLFTQELIAAAKRIEADVYAGHNLSALPAVVIAADANSVPAVFDFEDFHRGEDAENSVHWKKVMMVEDQYVTRLRYATTASPLITEAYSKLYPSLTITTINNCFPLRYLQPEPKKDNDGTLKLFWFSQFIGKNRGVENIIDALNLCDNLNISLHLLGNINDSYKTLLLNRSFSKNKIVFLPPCAPNEIFKIAAQFDVGLASETAFSENNNIALSNKLFTYLLCGNCVLLSDTDAQKKFLIDYPNVGFVYQIGNSEQLANIIMMLYNDRNLLSNIKNNALKLATDNLNWENEGQILLKKVNSLITAY